MTIDERLDRLTERHEALTQSVEMLLVSSQESTRQIDMLLASSQESNRRVDLLTNHMDNLADSVGIISQLLRSHENRLDRLEGGK